MRQLGWKALLPLLVLFPGAAPVVAQNGDDIELWSNVAYLENAGYANDKDKLDIYAPSGASDAPVFVFIHGGRLLNGDKDQQQHVGRTFAEQGFVTVCINTRLSPTVTHPSHAEDAAAAIAWVERNIAVYGGDPQRIALGGFSSGAYLSALVALDGRFLRAAGTRREVIRALVAISGFFRVDRIAPETPMSVWGEDQAVWRDASPAWHVSADAPPTLLVWADGDTDARRQESYDFATELLEHGARRVDTSEIADRDHRSIWSRIGSERDPTGSRVVSFLRAVLTGGPT